MSYDNFEYSFLKSERTSEIILIVHLQKEWLNKEVEFLIKDNSLDIIVNDRKYNSGELPEIVSSWLKNNAMKVFFANDDGNIVSEAIIGED